MKDQAINTEHITLSELVTAQVESIKEKLIQTIALIKQDEINRTPFEGSWTAGQVGEHINLSVSGMIKTLSAPVNVTEREPDRYVKGIKDMFLNFNLKFSAAPGITPTDKHQDKETLINTLTNTFKGFINIVRAEDLTGTFPGVEFPGMGPLTRLEWVYLTIYHTQRHIHQLKEMKKFF
ncbi:MAG: DinB family protein [Mucilaginibacter sp.]|nr:DinB family protein [Mucilaginibacter sp.]